MTNDENVDTESPSIDLQVTTGSSDDTHNEERVAWGKRIREVGDAVYQLFSDLAPEVTPSSIWMPRSQGRAYWGVLNSVEDQFRQLLNVADLVDDELAAEVKLLQLRFDAGDRVVRDDDSRSTCPALVQKEYAEAAITQLGKQAESGDDSAIRALRDIGIDVAHQLDHLVAEGENSPAREVAEKSGIWPIWISAIEEHQGPDFIAKVKALKLGSSLPIRTKQKSGSGGVRNFADGTQADFALKVWEKLHNMRLASPLSAGIDCGESESWARWVRQKIAEIGKVASTQEQRESLWQWRAQLLPPFSQNDEVLRQWRDVGVLFLEAKCKGKWEDYQWPMCVRNRCSGRNNGEHRSALSAIRELLLVGLRALP